MGKRNSSVTRISPVFTSLLMRDPTGKNWLDSLLGLPERFDLREPPRPSRTGVLRRCAWYPEEAALPAPVPLLQHLVEHPPSAARGAPGKRGLLADRDNEVVAEARRALGERATTATDRAWYVFEGPTSIDAYLETDDLLVLIEGKRTESGPTTTTTWMPVRHQILRNIDAVWDTRGERAVVAFFVVDGDPVTGLVSEAWQGFSRATVSESALRGSLPHRDSTARREIADCYFGVTTWQAVCRELDVRVRLPDCVTIDYDGANTGRRPGQTRGRE
jgi:hypothetical protein